MHIEGEGLEHLEKEAGGHRIQRVPPTEKRGRIHTSTVTVAVLADQPIFQKKISLDDCEISWFSGSGAGGQHRNKHQNCCRLRHKQTGMTETAQCRSRTQSLEEAFKALSQRVNNHISLEKTEELAGIRKLQVGSGQRGDKIRTIYLQRDLVVDHRNGRTTTAIGFCKGHIEGLWN